MEKETLKETKGITGRTALKIIGGALLLCVLGISALLCVALIRFTTEVKVQALYSRREMRLPIFAHYYFEPPTGDRVKFSIGKSVEKIGNIIREWDEETEIIIQDKMIFVSNQNLNEETQDYYFLWKGAEGYGIMNMGGWVHSDDVSEHILLPYHFLEIPEGGVPYNESMKAGVEYSLQADVGINDIARFYEDAGYFDVERNGNEISIVWGDKPVFVQPELRIPSRKIMMEYVEANQSLIIDISEQMD